MNPIKHIKLNILPRLSKKNKSQYVLRQKTEKLPIKDFPQDCFTSIPDNAEFYTLVRIGKKKDPNFERSVLTFYDKNYMIQRDIKGDGTNQKKRIYDEIWKIENGFKGPFTRKRNITTKELNPDTRWWETTQEEEQFTRTFADEKNYVYKKGFAKKIHINKNVHERVNGEKIIHSTITEYPKTYSKDIFDTKKVFSADIKLTDDIPQIVKINPETNVKLPQRDKFKPYRLLTGEQKQKSLTRFYLNENGLKPLDIDIVFMPKEVPENADGFFDNHLGKIVFKKPTHNYPVTVASHEGEHARQYSLAGRLGKLRTSFGLRCEKQLPPVTEMNEIQEGIKYVIASEKYPKLSPTENLRENPEYWFNDLEVGARLKAKKMEDTYKKGRDRYQEIFPVTEGSNSF